MLIKHLFFQELDFSERKIFILSLEDVFVLIFLLLDKLLECEYALCICNIQWHNKKVFLKF